MSFIAVMISTNYLGMKNSEKLTTVMQQCIVKLEQHGTLIRWNGGYWTRVGCPVKTIFNGEIKIPKWSFTEGTIRSLIDRGIVIVVDTRYDSYKGRYINTAVKLAKNVLPS